MIFIGISEVMERSVDLRREKELGKTIAGAREEIMLFIVY